MNYWGDNLRFFIGKVIQIANDPQARGRAQIFIFGIHSDNPADMKSADFPWAEVMLPTSDGGVSGLNQSGGPGLIPTATVFGVFLDGKGSQLPIVLGTLPKLDRIQAYTPRATQEILKGTPENVGKETWGGAFTPNELRNVLENDPDVRTKRLALMYFFTKQKVYDPVSGKHVRAFTPKQAAGIVGNLQGENSTFDPALQSQFPSSTRSDLFTQQFGAEGLASIGIPEDRSKEPSFGLAQWNANVGRFQHLFEYSRTRPESWDDFWLQAEFICWTLYGSGNQKTGAGYNRSAFNALKKTTKIDGGMNNPASSTWIWLKKYEKPVITPAVLSIRERYAREALADYENAIAQSVEDDTGGPR